MATRAGTQMHLLPQTFLLLVLGCPKVNEPLGNGIPVQMNPEEKCSFAELAGQAAFGADDGLARRISHCAFQLPSDEQQRSDLLWIFSMWTVSEWIDPVVEVATIYGPSALETVEITCRKNSRTLPSGLTCTGAIRERASILGSRASDDGDFRTCALVFALLAQEYQQSENADYYLYRRIQCLNAAGRSDAAIESWVWLRTQYPESKYLEETRTLLGISLDR